MYFVQFLALFIFKKYFVKFSRFDIISYTLVPELYCKFWKQDIEDSKRAFELGLQPQKSQILNL